MPFRRVPALTLLVCLTCCSLSSCLARRRLITRKTSNGKTAPTLLVADQATLLAVIARQYRLIRDFSATVDMVPALGSAEKNRITEYKDVRGYIVFRKPADIRIIGLLPVVRNKAFDMVSNGTDFKLYIPSRARLIVGSNQLTTPSANKIENLRPQHFLEALLVSPVDPSVERPLLENFTDEENAAYVLHLVREEAGGRLHIQRTVWFNRLDLLIARQFIFDEKGNILTDARYSDWQAYDGVAFPKHIEINRPHDEYAVVINVVKMDINKGMGDDKFVLDQPEGTVVQKVGEKAPDAPPPAPAKPARKTRQK